MKTCIVLPTYNEAENLAPLVEQLLKLALPDSHVLIIDDNSKDGTGQIADGLAREISTDACLSFTAPARWDWERLMSLGSNGRWREAPNASSRWTRIFPTPPATFLTLFPRSASTTSSSDHATCRAASSIRAGAVGAIFLSKWANSVWVHWILGLQVRDATAGFKCWSRRALRENLARERSFERLCLSG